MPESSNALIELRNVSKNFGPNKVLRDVSFELYPGEIHSLVGENGAGKSTSLGLMYGLLQPDAGEVCIEGKPVTIESPAHAKALGVSCVFQELSLAGGVSVAENIFAGHTPARFGVIDRATLKKQAEALLADFGVDIDVMQNVDNLSISMRQIVEIAKALSLKSKILLLDEPTSALTPDEVESLFLVLKKLAKKGIGIIYISHHMSEIFSICDRITTLRDGRQINTYQVAHTHSGQIVSDMIGGEVPISQSSNTNVRGPVVLEAENLTLAGEFKDISFCLHSAEIIGIAGLMGSRRSLIAKTIAGLVSGWSGEMRIKNTPVHFCSLLAAIQAGVGYVPQERKTEGLFLDFSVCDNLIAASLEKHTKHGVLSKASAAKTAAQAIADFSIKTDSHDIPMRSLSGGNQQKVMLAKWLERDPKILVIDEPTKGVDIGAKFQIHRELRKRANNGMAIVVVSSDFSELATLVDRIIVVRDGEIAGEIQACDASEEKILKLAASGLQAKQPTKILTSRSTVS